MRSELRFSTLARPSRALGLTLALAALAGCRSSADAKAAATPPAAVAAPTTEGGETVAVPATAGTSSAMPPDSTALRTAADLGRIEGSPSAKVWLIEASDFQCPYCKTWHDQSYETLRREYVETGKIRVAYLNYPLTMHVQAMAAAEAAMCASAQGKFWPYHTALFTAQERWGKPGDQSATFDSLATANGVDVTRFRTCTQSHVMRALIAADQDRMETRGVQSTPSFFVGSQAITGAQPVGVFRQVIDGALAQAR